MAQDLVADGVAVRVVDALEVVDVDERDGQRPVVAVGPLDLGREDLQAGETVQEAGQLVGRGQGLDVSDPRAKPVDRGREDAIRIPDRGWAIGRVVVSAVSLASARRSVSVARRRARWRPTTSEKARAPRIMPTIRSATSAMGSVSGSGRSPDPLASRPHPCSAIRCPPARRLRTAAPGGASPNGPDRRRSSPVLHSRPHGEDREE